MPKTLIAWGYASFLILATLGCAVADPDEPVVDVPATPATSAGVPTTDTGSNSNKSPSSDNSQSGDNTLPPDNTQAAPNSQVPTTPFLPQQAANLYSPFTLTPSTLNVQSPQLTAPGLYTTGTTDISQAATNNALLQAFSNQSTPGFTSSDQEGGYSHPPIERIRVGPIDIKAALASSIVADDDIRSGNNGTGTNQDQGSKGDVFYNVTPAVLLVYGQHEGQRGYATLVYSPTITRYFHHSDENSTNQNVAFNAQYPFQRLTLNLSESYSQVTGVNSDSNTRTTQSSNLTMVGASYEVDEKLTLTSQLQYVTTSFSNPGGQETNQIQTGDGGETASINNSLYYHLSDKFSVGPSFNFGIDKQQDENQQTFEQVLMGVTYQPRPKFNFFLQGGVELRQTDGNNNNNNNETNQSSGDEINPIFSAGVGYTPFDSTSLNVNASQSVHSSDVGSGQTVLNTAVGVDLNQRFFQRLYLDLSFNYSHNDSQNGAGTTNVVTTSQDTSNNDSLSYRASLSISPTAWSSVAVYYQYLDNESDDSTDSYHDNQVGLSISAQF